MKEYKQVIDQIQELQRFFATIQRKMNDLDIIVNDWGEKNKTIADKKESNNIKTKSENELREQYKNLQQKTKEYHKILYNSPKNYTDDQLEEIRNLYEKSYDLGIEIWEQLPEGVKEKEEYKNFRCLTKEESNLYESALDVNGSTSYAKFVVLEKRKYQRQLISNKREE